MQSYLTHFIKSDSFGKKICFSLPGCFDPLPNLLIRQFGTFAVFDTYVGRELFLADASLFVDDAEAYEKYHREEEPDNSNQKAQESSSTSGPSTSTSVAAVSEEGNFDIDDDDDDLDMDELNELEASLSRTSIQIKEPEKTTFIYQEFAMVKFLVFCSLTQSLVGLSQFCIIYGIGSSIRIQGRYSANPLKS
ncbi:zinc finger C-x8-C-x5-C-x3-H type family protein [Artemisia annua]|uniref:Zinc finger C-x8-C-x5-C-x3-H type family protein n=1 Tax=Artemisia annua TaxID=35608 RepID=A0A2U1LRD4_ARTAN|nr:zinc finger C-x8-C-x5-C-x3-H type family protein [Artemisia annua]